MAGHSLKNGNHYYCSRLFDHNLVILLCPKPRSLQSPCHSNGDEPVGSHGPRVSLSSVLSHLWGCSKSCSKTPSSPIGESGVGGSVFLKISFYRLHDYKRKVPGRVRACVYVESLHSCPTLCDPMDCIPPCSSVHKTSQARVLEWVTISSSRGSSQPRDRTLLSCVSCIGRQVLYH